MFGLDRFLSGSKSILASWLREEIDSKPVDSIYKRLCVRIVLKFVVRINMMPLKMTDFNFASDFEIAFLTRKICNKSLYLGSCYTYIIFYRINDPSRTNRNTVRLTSSTASVGFNRVGKSLHVTSSSYFAVTGTSVIIIR